jgi:hypothetical protein
VRVQGREVDEPDDDPALEDGLVPLFHRVDLDVAVDDHDDDSELRGDGLVTDARRRPYHGR